jgi:hypothetical protein
LALGRIGIIKGQVLKLGGQNLVDDLVDAKSLLEPLDRRSAISVASARRVSQ